VLLAPQDLPQEFDLLLEHRIAFAQLFDPATGVENGRVVATTEAPSDIG
jgi:hypothetical protein